MAQAIRAILLARAIAATFVGRRANNAPAPGSMELGVPDHRQRASREQTAQIPVALFSDPAEPLLPAAGVLLRYEADPSREIPS